MVARRRWRREVSDCLPDRHVAIGSKPRARERKAGTGIPAKADYECAAAHLRRAKGGCLEDGSVYVIACLIPFTKNMHDVSATSRAEDRGYILHNNGLRMELQCHASEVKKQIVSGIGGAASPLDGKSLARRTASHDINRTAFFEDERGKPFRGKRREIEFVDVRAKVNSIGCACMLIPVSRKYWIKSGSAQPEGHAPGAAEQINKPKRHQAAAGKVSSRRSRRFIAASAEEIDLVIGVVTSSF